eukprot:m.32773 g.32773  ORF g.32773 m.32773 type:complete len:137 (-) comp6408_c0_seq2:1050-1460(-)
MEPRFFFFFPPLNISNKINLCDNYLYACLRFLNVCYIETLGAVAVREGALVACDAIDVDVGDDDVGAGDVGDAGGVDEFAAFVGDVGHETIGPSLAFGPMPAFVRWSAFDPLGYLVCSSSSLGVCLVRLAWGVPCF